MFYSCNTVQLARFSFSGTTTRTSVLQFISGNDHALSKFTYFTAIRLTDVYVYNKSWLAGGRTKTWFKRSSILIEIRPVLPPLQFLQRRPPGR